LAEKSRCRISRFPLFWPRRSAFSAFALAFCLRLSLAEGLRLSLALAQCGEFGFILFSTAQSGGLMTAQLTALASMLITISMLATPFLVRFGGRLTAARLLAYSTATHGGAARTSAAFQVSASRKELR
jgi:Kef-type K+ transport system membrane component KefB